MSRLSHGVDIVEVERLRQACERNPALLAAVFTAEERGRCRAAATPFSHLAGSFAAKEACLKALGLGVCAPDVVPALADVEVRTSREGQTTLALSGWIGSLARRRGVRTARVSIGHTDALAVAIVFLAGESTVEG